MTGKCRFCEIDLEYVFADVGMSPLSNSYLKKEELNKKELFYPLKAYVCENCKLVQLEEFESPKNIFSDYLYFSSYSTSWLNHAKSYVEMMTQKFQLSNNSLVVEIASNDGYLLQYFVGKNIPVLGVEPAKNVAIEAEKKGVPTITEFFGADFAIKYLEKYQKPNLILGNNVYAHVPDIKDFTLGMKKILHEDGVITLEFPHLLQLMESNQFDTIYHEHFSYLSLFTVEQIMNKHQLRVFDVEELPTHGGSLRIYITHENNQNHVTNSSVEKLRNKETEAGLNQLAPYVSFESKMRKVKRDLLSFLIEQKEKGKRIAGYGAPAKGNTLLNYCGVKKDFIDFTVDRSPHKQNNYLPGSHIPILSVEEIEKQKPDFVLILPWNLKNEIKEQMTKIRGWGAKFVVPIPKLEIF